MSQKVRNAVYIKFRILKDSIAIRLALLLMVMLSSTLSFWPLISNVFNSDGVIYLETEIPFINIEKYDIEKKDSGGDVKVTFKDGIYVIDVLTKDGNKNLDSIQRLIYERNIESVISSGLLPTEEIMKVMNTNLQVNVKDELKNKLTGSSYDFLMGFVLVYDFLIILLISRISAQVAYEKGNKLTEVILTSLKRKELYFAQVAASILVVIANLIIISIPIIAAYIINDSNITSDLSFFSLEKLVQFIFHLIICTISLVIFAIGLSSRVKQSEDVNAYTAVVIIPVFFSLMYLVFNLDMYRGIFYILNYVPLASIFPVLGATLNESINTVHFLFIEMVTVVLIIIEYFAVRKLYVNNISKK